ncbi:MAG: Sec-independent protein translocase subunit TatA/TatB [Blastocatellia bacterium]
MLGATEIALILLAALIIFGPRKLPELGKSFGQAMAQFRRASEDFKRTWEQEVEIEKVRKSDDTSGSAGYDYNASESYNPYAPNGEDPYSNDSTNGSSTAQLPAASGDKSVEPPAASPETAAAAAAEKKHWI